MSSRIPLVSVILPHFNHLQYLAERVINVLAQTYWNIEVILLDDATPGFSESDVPRDSRIRMIVVNQINSRSPFRQWMKGLAGCQGDYVWIAETDDFATPAFLEIAVGALEKYTQSGFFFGETVRLNSKGSELFCIPLNKDFSSIKLDRYGLKLIKRSAIWGILDGSNRLTNVSGCLFRRNMLTPLAAKIKEFNHLGDWYTYLELSSRAPAVFAPNVVNYQRVNSSNMAFSEFPINRAYEVASEHKKLFCLQFELGYISYDEYLFRSEKTKERILKFARLEDRLRQSALMAPAVKVVIFGAGAYGKYVIGLLQRLRIQVACVIDRIGLSSLEADGFCGVPLMTLEEFSDTVLASNCRIIIASVAFEDEILAELRHHNLHNLVF